jgi:hypothetical protein
MGQWETGVKEWWLEDLTFHPFHLHVYHFQIVSPCGPWFDVGEFYDTVHHDGSCKIRFRTNFPTRRVMLHCHHLRHEDSGAMAWGHQITNASIITEPCCQIGGTHCSTPCVDVPVDNCNK